MVERTAVLDMDLTATLPATLPVPLVLHGPSGVPDGEIRRAIAAGMTKINISTHLVSVFTAAIREVLGTNQRWPTHVSTCARPARPSPGRRPGCSPSRSRAAVTEPARRPSTCQAGEPLIENVLYPKG
jgi:fructose/tagatose bisphosphate aldolase